MVTILAGVNSSFVSISFHRESKIQTKTVLGFFTTLRQNLVFKGMVISALCVFELMTSCEV